MHAKYLGSTVLAENDSMQLHIDKKSLALTRVCSKKVLDTWSCDIAMDVLILLQPLRTYTVFVFQVKSSISIALLPTSKMGSSRLPRPKPSACSAGFRRCCINCFFVYTQTSATKMHWWPFQRICYKQEIGSQWSLAAIRIVKRSDVCGIKSLV